MTYLNGKLENAMRLDITGFPLAEIVTDMVTDFPQLLFALELGYTGLEARGLTGP